MILYMLQVLIPGISQGWDDVQTGTFACAVTTVTCIPLFFLCWKYLFSECPPIQQHGIPDGQSLLTTGFTKLIKTQRYISQQLPHVNIFLGTMMFSEAANSALATISTTYMKEVLDMNATEIGAAFLVVLVSGLPGTWIGHAICHRYNNPVTSTKICLVVYITSTSLACITLVPEYKNLIYVYCAFFGICQGWIHPQHTTIFVTITTASTEAEINSTDETAIDTAMEDDNDEEDKEGNEQPQTTINGNNHRHDGSALMSSPLRSMQHQQQHQQQQQQQQGVAELMGVFLFACQILSFLPPLVFTFLNELGMSMQIGMGSLVLFFIVGYWGLIQMGDYHRALESIVLQQHEQEINDATTTVSTNRNFCDTTHLTNSTTLKTNDGSSYKKDDDGLQIGVFA